MALLEIIEDKFVKIAHSLLEQYKDCMHSSLETVFFPLFLMRDHSVIFIDGLFQPPPFIAYTAAMKEAHAVGIKGARPFEMLVPFHASGVFEKSYDLKG